MAALAAISACVVCVIGLSASGLGSSYLPGMDGTKATQLLGYSNGVPVLDP